jgi:hypothetical protein
VTAPVFRVRFLAPTTTGKSVWRATRHMYGSQEQAERFAPELAQRYARVRVTCGKSSAALAEWIDGQRIREATTGGTR